MPARYALVVAGSKDSAVEMVKAFARQAISDRRLRVIQGDLLQKQEFFPTKEASAWLRRAYNRGGSSPDPADRDRSLAIIFFQFYPTTRTLPVALAHAREAAAAVGFKSESTDVCSFERSEDLRDFLEEQGFLDVVEAGDTVATFLDALVTFQREFTDDAIVSNRAKTAATGWVFPDPGRVLRDLRAVHRVYGRWTDRHGQPITARARKEVLNAEAGITLHSESPEVTKKYRRSRFPEMGGRELEYPLHIPYSFRSTRVHFWFAAPKDREHESVKSVVAHAGKHLFTGERSQSDSG